MSTLLQQVVVGALTGSALVAQIASPSATLIVDETKNIVADTTVTSLSAMRHAPDELDLWLEGLAQLESHGNPDTIVLDVNGRYSYGCLQFQRATFIGFGRGYGILTDNHLENIDAAIYDCNLQKQIARRMIQKDPGAWKHWYTSVAKRGLGLPPGTTEHQDDIARR